MKIVNINLRVALAATVLGVVIAIAGAQLFILEGTVAAYEPDGLSMWREDIPEPPCPFGHDDVCESGPPLTSANPYRSHDPRALVPHTDTGHHRLEQLASIALINRQLAARDFQSPDGLTGGDTESDASGSSSYAITSEITGLPWVSDGLTTAELLTKGWLVELQEHNPALVSALTRMPFLQDHTPGDLQAIQTLTLISAGTSRIAPNPEEATAIATYAAFADGGGIDNTEAKIIAVTSIPYLSGGTDLVFLLADYGTVEEANTVGQYGNQVNFAIIRLLTSRQDSELMLSATTATQDAETLMGQALPVDFVGILVADSSDFAGANNSIHIQVDAGYDGTYTDRRRQYTVAHEIAHYWWGAGGVPGHEDWIAEGVASYVGAYSVKQRTTYSALSTGYYPCPYYRTVEHMRADNPQYTLSYGSLCNYSLAGDLFINLDRNMSDASFATALRSLHQRLSSYKDDEIDQGLSLMNAFCPQCLLPLASSDNIGHTLARRYGEKIFTDSSAPSGSITGLGSAQTARIQDYSGANRQYGIAEVSASSPDQRRWLTVTFSDVSNPPETVRIEVVQYYEDRYPHYSSWQERKVYSVDGRAWFSVYLGNPIRRPIGHHWVYVYNDSGQKIAEAEYQVLP